MSPARYRRTAAVSITAASAICLAMLSAPSATAATPKVTIGSTKPTWLPRATRKAAAVKRTGKQTVQVYLNPEGGLEALKAKVASLSDPSSADYRQWLTPAQYAASYEPSTASVNTVSNYLTSQGLRVGTADAHHRFVPATGTVAQLNKAFGVTLGEYAHDGQTVTAPSTAATLPADVGAKVLTITGLDTTQRAVKHSVTPPDGFVNGRPCSTYFGQLKATVEGDYKTPLPPFEGKTLSYAPCGYTGPQFRAAYEGATTQTGKGVTVAITDAYAWQFIAKDANKYATEHGDGAYTAGQLTQVPAAKYTKQAQCDPSGWSGEETLDVEAVHAMAPDANIRYYASASCFDADFLVALGNVVQENKAQIVTNSWADVEQAESAGSIQAYEQVFLQGATQGISFLFSSGDNGDELASTGLKQVDYPASDPYATAVGGTSTAIDSDGSLKSETGWGTNKYSLSADGTSWTSVGFLYGAGGGYSSLFNRPTYQNGVVPAAAPAGRAVPDIAMDADPSTGMLVGQTQTFPEGVHYGEYRIGGTSLASPLSAGFFALLAQKGGGKGLGLLNPFLYSTSSTSALDVKHAGPLGVVRSDYANALDPSGGLLYSVRTFDQDSSLKTAKGWDPVTGIGSLNPALLG